FANLTEGVNAVRPGRTTMRQFDLLLVISAASLALFGVLMVYSASIALADGPRFGSIGRYFFVSRHASFLVVGTILALLVWMIPMSVIQKVTQPLFVIATILLVLVLVPVIGSEVNGASRWIRLGPLN